MSIKFTNEPIKLEDNLAKQHLGHDSLMSLAKRRSRVRILPIPESILSLNPASNLDCCFSNIFSDLKSTSHLSLSLIGNGTHILHWMLEVWRHQNFVE